MSLINDVLSMMFLSIFASAFMMLLARNFTKLAETAVTLWLKK